MSIMRTIYHITQRHHWELAKVVGRYEPPSLSMEGFIHFSSAQQVKGTLKRYYSGQTDLVLLKVNLQPLRPNVRFEGAIEKFPHLYAALNITDVAEVFLISGDQLPHDLKLMD